MVRTLYGSFSMKRTRHIRSKENAHRTRCKVDSNFLWESASWSFGAADMTGFEQVAGQLEHWLRVALQNIGCEGSHSASFYAAAMEGGSVSLRTASMCTGDHKDIKMALQDTAMNTAKSLVGLESRNGHSRGSRQVRYAIDCGRYSCLGSSRWRIARIFGIQAHSYCADHAL